MSEYSVYMHQNMVNNKKYIGLTKQKPQDRWGVNGKNYKNRCPHFWAAIQKYGWNNFRHDIIANHLSKEQAQLMQIQLIKKYHTQDNHYGYNIMSGGSSPSIPQEVRQKMSQSMLGNKNGYGKPCSAQKAKKNWRRTKRKKIF